MNNCKKCNRGTKSEVLVKEVGGYLCFECYTQYSTYKKSRKRS